VLPFHATRAIHSPLRVPVEPYQSCLPTSFLASSDLDKSLVSRHYLRREAFKDARRNPVHQDRWPTHGYCASRNLRLSDVVRLCHSIWWHISFRRHPPHFLAATSLWRDVRILRRSDASQPDCTRRSDSEQYYSVYLLHSVGMVPPLLCTALAGDRKKILGLENASLRWE